jgi:hypothetical protein
MVVVDDRTCLGGSGSCSGIWWAKSRSSCLWRQLVWRTLKVADLMWGSELALNVCASYISPSAGMNEWPEGTTHECVGLRVFIDNLTWRASSYDPRGGSAMFAQYTK